MAQSAGASRLDPEADRRVLERIKRAPSGASAIDIAKASLGWRAKKHTSTSLTMIGLAVATRLIGEGLITPSRTNLFKAAEPQIGSDAVGTSS
ncbi:hypothetical protein [Tardiphaga sp.]|uniref:hypothetical protein n=1 Tax=Tardiphaga sp. TaxID=1926292 RepID=UPI00262F7710|nr:hypothetical protein [Tardiphaga sp.]MDB5617476.1 hypothetical protein [Tardiphaga sp.]